MVSEAGKFVVLRKLKKQSTAAGVLGVEVRFNQLVRPMFYGSQHVISNISIPEGKERFYTIVGYICESDTFAANRKIAEIKEGDLLCFSNAGAYSFTMSSNYNSRYRPAEVLWYNGKAHLISKRETFEDLIRNQVEVEM